MRIPKRGAVEFVINSVLKKRSVKSQEDFMSLVSSELRKVDPEYSITGRRLREIASSMQRVSVEVVTRKGKPPSRCPACSSSLRKTWTRNLKGRKVMQGLSCPRCGYMGNSGRWSPARYSFRLR